MCVCHDWSAHIHICVVGLCTNSNCAKSTCCSVVQVHRIIGSQYDTRVAAQVFSLVFVNIVDVIRYTVDAIQRNTTQSYMQPQPTIHCRLTSTSSHRLHTWLSAAREFYLSCKSGCWCTAVSLHAPHVFVDGWTRNGILKQCCCQLTEEYMCNQHFGCSVFLPFHCFPNAFLFKNRV